LSKKDCNQLYEKTINRIFIYKNEGKNENEIFIAIRIDLKILNLRNATV